MGTEIVEPTGLRGAFRGAFRGGSTTIGFFRSPRGGFVFANEDGARREPSEDDGGCGDLTGVGGITTHGRGASWISRASFLDILRIMYQIKMMTRRRAPTPPPIAPPRLAGSVEELALQLSQFPMLSDEYEENGLRRSYCRWYGSP